MVQRGIYAEDDFDSILEYSDMCYKHGSDAVDDYMEFHDILDNFDEAYCGEWDREEYFAHHIVEECYNLELKIAEYLLNKLNMKQKMMGNLVNYFDYEAFARELFMYDYQMSSYNNVFRTI